MMRAALLACATALVTVSGAHCSPDKVTVSVYVDAKGEGKAVFGVNDPAAPAVALYSDAVHHPSFFGTLDVVTRASASDTHQLYAAGFAEGAVTAKRIHENYINVNAWLSGRVESLDKLNNFFAEQLQWARGQASSNSSALWTHVGLVLSQLDGLHDGYNFAAAQPHSNLPALDMSVFLILNGVGDALDLLSALYPETRPDWENLTPGEREATVASSGHCSGLVAVTGNFSDLFMAHSSWFIYQGMLRIYKHYHFAISAPHTGAHRISFSSYPGFLESLDDYYMMDSGLVMIQTTNSVFNHTLYDLITPHSLMAWQRVRVASQMARTGAQWASAVAAYNSGTYNNQYMVVDTSLFEKGKGVGAGLLTVVEQIPGLVVSGDQTEILQFGHFPSYNVPFYREIYDRSGYQQMLQRYGEDAGLSGLSYQDAPRAKIFRRDAAKVVDMASLKALMRYNDFKNDPYSGGSAYGAICSRGDLAAHPSPGGCYDSKVANYDMARNLTAQAINGPTAEDLPPFSWDAFNKTSHVGMPQLFNFEFETMQPAGLA